TLRGCQSQTTVFASLRHSRTRRVCHHRASGDPFSSPRGATASAQGYSTPYYSDRVRGSGSCCWPLELGLGTRRLALRCCEARASLILLDTSALLWLQGRHTEPSSYKASGLSLGQRLSYWFSICRSLDATK